MKAAPSDINMQREACERRAHLLLLSLQKGDKWQANAQWLKSPTTGYIIPQQPTETHLCPLSVFWHHSVFTILAVPPTSCASHFYWSNCIYFIIFNLACNQISKHFYPNSIFCPLWVILQLIFSPFILPCAYLGIMALEGSCPGLLPSQWSLWVGFLTGTICLSAWMFRSPTKPILWQLQILE